MPSKLEDLKEKGAARGCKRPKSREETPKEGSGSAERYRTATICPRIAQKASVIDLLFILISHGWPAPRRAWQADPQLHFSPVISMVNDEVGSMSLVRPIGAAAWEPGSAKGLP